MDIYTENTLMAALRNGTLGNGLDFSNASAEGENIYYFNFLWECMRVPPPGFRKVKVIPRSICGCGLGSGSSEESIYMAGDEGECRASP